jgi:hypothetical protein
MTDRAEPTADDKKRPENPMGYDIAAIRRAIEAGQIPAEVLAEFRKETE